MADNRILSAIQALGPSFEMADRADRSAAPARLQSRVTTPAGDRATVDQIAQVNAKLADISTDATVGAELGSVGSIRQFLTAGHAIFTIVGKETRYTFKIVRKDPDVGSTYTQPAYFVSLLTGPNNVQDYTYVGLLIVQDGCVRVTRKSAYKQDSRPVVALNWALGRIWRGQDLAPSGRFYHVGRCGRCGRALTVPASIETGLGPECAGKLGEA